LLGELLPALLLGQVQVAPGGATDDDRDPEEAVHLGMAAGKAIAARVLPHVGQPQRTGVVDQHAEYASAAGKVADRPVGGRVDPRRQEPLEPCAALIQYS